MEWGASKSAVLAYDTREVSSEDETSVILTGGSDAAELVSYTFDETGLKGAVVIVKTSYSAEMVKFLGERYKYLGEDNDIFMFSNKDVAVGMKVQNYKYLAIVYIPNTTNKSLSLTQADVLLSALPALDEERSARPKGQKDYGPAPPPVAGWGFSLLLTNVATTLARHLP